MCTASWLYRCHERTNVHTYYFYSVLACSSLLLHTLQAASAVTNLTLQNLADHSSAMPKIKSAVFASIRKHVSFLEPLAVKVLELDHTVTSMGFLWKSHVDRKREFGGRRGSMGRHRNSQLRGSRCGRKPCRLDYSTTTSWARRLGYTPKHRAKHYLSDVFNILDEVSWGRKCMWFTTSQAHAHGLQPLFLTRRVRK